MNYFYENKIIKTTHLLINNKLHYYWSHGVVNTTEIILIQLRQKTEFKVSNNTWHFLY
jgi:hypothetical protein